MIGQGDVWKALEQWRANNQQWNHRPHWQLDQFSGVSARPPARPGWALVWVGRSLTALGIWLQNRYGDTCLIQVEANNPQAQTPGC